MNLKNYALFYPDGRAELREWVLGQSWSALRKEAGETPLIFFCSYSEPNGRWYRMDLTPVLLNDVPKEYQLQLLLLT